jgi:hypothetical protein
MDLLPPPTIGGTNGDHRRSHGKGDSAVTEKPNKHDPKNDDKKSDVDEQSEDSFPASDPPSYAGGKHSIGEPPRPDSHTDKLSKK